LAAAAAFQSQARDALLQKCHRWWAMIEQNKAAAAAALTREYVFLSIQFQNTAEKNGMQTRGAK